MRFQKKHNQENPEEKGLVPLRDMMDRLFSESFLFPSFTDSFFSEPFFGSPSRNVLGGVKVDVEESEKEFLVKAELPGADPEKIDLDLTETRLTIVAELGGEKEDKGKNYLRRECSYGQIKRTFDFSNAPIEVEKSSADFKNGVLKITLPKKGEKKELGKKIPINS